MLTNSFPIQVLRMKACRSRQWPNEVKSQVHRQSLIKILLDMGKNDMGRI